MICIIVLLMVFTELSYGFSTWMNPEWIHVVEGDSYVIGLENSSGITKCLYKTDDGLENEFYVANNDDEIDIMETSGQRNFVLTLGDVGLCKIKLVNAHPGGPMSWTISGYNNESVIVEMKTVNVQLITQNSLAYVPKSQHQYVVEGGNFLVGYKRNPVINKCYIRTKTNRTFIDLSRSNNQLEIPIGENLNLYTQYKECTVYGIKAKAGANDFIEITVGNENRNIATKEFFVHTFSKEDVTFEPQVKRMYFTKNIEYKFGFAPYVGIKRCNVYYNYWNTIQRMNFNVDQKRILNSELNITHDKGACNIKIQTDNYVSKGTWEITASDGLNDIQTKVLKSFYYGSVPILSKEIILNNGEGFYQSLIDDFQFDKCIIQFEDTIIEFSKSQRIESENDVYKLSEHLIIEGHQKCAFKLTHLDLPKRRNMQWVLIGVSKSETIGNSFNVKLLNREVNTEVQVEMGSQHTIKCGPDDQTYCKLFNPKKVLVYEGDRCEHNIKMVTADDIGMWECYSIQPGSMQSMLFNIRVDEIEPNEMTGWSRSDEFNQIIECKLKRNIPIDFCCITSPSKTMYNLQPHINSATIDALSTNLNIGYCSLKVKLPLNETGIWKCEAVKGNRTFGTVISVGINNSKEIIFEKKSKLRVHPRTNFLLEFEVPFSARQCYIVAPNGEVFINQLSFQPKLGLCSLKVNRRYEFKEGIWTCFFGRDKNKVYEKIEIEVVYENISPNFMVEEIDNEKTSAKLYCHFGKPLRSCIFLSPTNQSYFIREHQKNLRMNYYGQGFWYGDCGIYLTNINSSDFGNWTCISKFASFGKHYATIALVNANSIQQTIPSSDKISANTVAEIAIAAILTLIVITGAYIIYRKYSR